MVLPAPFGPRKPNTPPSGTARSSPSTAIGAAAPQAPVLLAEPLDLDHVRHASHPIAAKGCTRTDLRCMWRCGDDSPQDPPSRYHRAPMSAPLTAPSLLGSLLANRYEIRAPLGRGGMGEVFEAVDRRLGRTVAIKVLRPELAADDRFLARFRREAATAAGLAHVGIVSVHDIGEDAGRTFIVMEFVAGRTLADIARAVIHDAAPDRPASARRPSRARPCARPRRRASRHLSRATSWSRPTAR